MVLPVDARNQPDLALLQDREEVAQLVRILDAEAVQPLDQDQVGLHCGNVGKHPLEIRSLIGVMPLAVVAVFIENRDAVLFGVLSIALDLFFGLLDIG